MPTAVKQRSNGRRKRAVAKPAAKPLADALAQAAWADADRALAEALAEMEALKGAKTAAARADAQALLQQALTRAARRRGLVWFGAPGAIESFDPKRHELARASSRAPKQVRIASRGLARGSEILIKARVTSARGQRR